MITTRLSPKNTGSWAGSCILYASAVLTLDLGATYWWPSLRWTSPGGFDFVKCVSWLVLPFILSLPAMDWGYFTFRRWKRADLILFFLLTGAGFVALLLVPHVPQLAAMYPNQSNLSPDKKQALIYYYLLWDLSWLPGWEFLHRYFLLRAVAARWPRFGWLLVPLSEGVYHISKSPIEAIGMTAFSLVATQWSLRRRNILLPLLAHAAIELGLLVVLYG